MVLKKAKQGGNLRPDREDRRETKPGKQKDLKSAKVKTTTKLVKNDLSGTSAPAKNNADSTVSVDLQQSLLNVFTYACSRSLKDDFPRIVQEIKGHLFNRDFDRAFSHRQYLEIYAARWSPARSLAYLEILSILPDIEIALVGHPPKLTHSPVTKQANATTHNANGENTMRHPRKRVVCLGSGGGAELVALAGYLRVLEAQANGNPDCHVDLLSDPVVSLDCAFVDIADWAPVMQELHAVITRPIPRDENNSSGQEGPKTYPLGHIESLAATFLQHDVLRMPMIEMQAVLEHSTLVTLMFTLNELYASSMPLATKMLLSLTSALQAGALLLVVDSPGSYSSISINKGGSGPKVSEQISASKEEEKQYPMQWLLDHTLLTKASVMTDVSKTPVRQWKKVDSSDSRWFRLAPELKYPIDLEDMRYQMHLYQRI